jgi:ATPase subunit of ABC transporter with duplicated ATPase domains
MFASSQARQQLIDENKKKSEKIEELKSFVRRFSANASKAKQATSRANQIEKIKLEDIAKSSRVYPYIRFEQKKKIYSNVLEVKNLSKKYDDVSVLKKINFSVDVADRIAILGSNGIGKSTLLKCLTDDSFRDSGDVKWAINADIGYFAQDSDERIDSDLSLVDWMGQWSDESVDQEKIRSILGRLLFSRDNIYKSINIISGGEKRRMLFGKMMLQHPNVIIMDEPTNHLDMESIESLNSALSIYEGTIIFTSHDREFISSLANRVIELKTDGLHEHNNIENKSLEAVSMDI